MSLQIKKCNEGIRFSAYIQPRSSRNEISGLNGNRLKIRLTSPPVDGEANRMVIKFLSKSLKITPSRISIALGATSRNKTISIEGLDEESLMTKLKPFLKEAPQGA